MPTNTAQPAVQTSIVAAGTSPVTLSIPPVSEPLAIVITSGSAITVTAATTSRPVDIAHT
jgi:hypothetical protein